ncbi:ABC transporter permease [Arhodomonas aquaeolei]|uniref:ABC transporter permease n=1 Tax=Arhodomonas aquaeolei TaxID=2369 RepID=UPI0003802465|nr:FtsX-like permease family protein [Arhodomonas aquaeolei]
MILALRWLWRDWRGGELRLLALAVVVAVAAVTSVSWLAERVGAATEARAADLLAADRAVERPEPIPDGWLRRARSEHGLATARTAEFPSVVVAGERTQLVSVKAVTPGYPLRGELRVSDGLDGAERATTKTPAPGSVWVAPRLLRLLGLSVGDRLALGQGEFRIAGVITLEPDRGSFFNSLAPRVLMPYADLEGTGLIGPGSRVRYKLLVAGTPAAAAAFTDALVAEQGNAVEIETPEGQGRGIGEVVDRARRFLGLGALLTVVVAGVAVLLTVRHYAERQVLAVAVMRAVGARRRRLTTLFVARLFWLALFAGAVGAALGFVVHAGMLSLVADLIDRDIPPPGWRPLVVGWLTAAAALFGFALPTLLRLRDVPPMRVLRREAAAGLLRAGVPVAVAAVVVFALMGWQAGEWRLAAYVIAALAVAVGLLAVAARASIAAVRALVRRRGGRLLWLSGFTRRPWTAVVQIVGVGTGLMALFLLAVVRNDLLDAWRDRIPDDAANQFLINIQADERVGVRERLAQAGIDAAFAPMVRGRLVALNGDPVAEAEDVPADDDVGRRRGRREFNLTWSAEPQQGNEVVAGEWWGAAGDPGELSVETGFAERYGIALGDRLTFDIAGRRVSARVTSLREVDWESFRVNFFVVASPGTLDGLPATWLTSFHLPDTREGVIVDIIRDYPSVTAIDVTSILRTVRSIMDQGSSVVELMSLLTLAAGVLVLLAALQITGEQRRFEGALLRALGASGRRVRRLARYEFWLLGGVAGLIAGGVATGAGVFVAEGLFGLEYPFRPLTLVVGAAVGVITVWAAGGLAARRYQRSSPMRLLREGAD